MWLNTYCVCLIYTVLQYVNRFGGAKPVFNVLTIEWGNTNIWIVVPKNCNVYFVKGGVILYEAYNTPSTLSWCKELRFDPYGNQFLRVQRTGACRVAVGHRTGPSLIITGVARAIIIVLFFAGTNCGWFTAVRKCKQHFIKCTNPAKYWFCTTRTGGELLTAS